MRRLSAIPGLRDMQECYETDESCEQFRAAVEAERVIIDDAMTLMRELHRDRVAAMPPA